MPKLCKSGSTAASKRRKVFVSKVKKRMASNIAQEKAAREETKDKDYHPGEGEDRNNNDDMNGDSN